MLIILFKSNVYRPVAIFCESRSGSRDSTWPPSRIGLLWNVSRWYICLWLLTGFVNEVEMLLVVCQ